MAIITVDPTTLFIGIYITIFFWADIVWIEKKPQTDNRLCNTLRLLSYTLGIVLIFLGINYEPV